MEVVLMLVEPLLLVEDIVLMAMHPSQVQVGNREEVVVLVSPSQLEKQIWAMQLMTLIIVGARAVMDALTYGIPNI